MAECHKPEAALWALLNKHAQLPISTASKGIQGTAIPYKI